MTYTPRRFQILNDTGNAKVGAMQVQQHADWDRDFFATHPYASQEESNAAFAQAHKGGSLLTKLADATNIADPHSAVAKATKYAPLALPGVGTAGAMALGAASTLATNHDAGIGDLAQGAAGGLAQQQINQRLLGGQGIAGVPGAVSRAGQAVLNAPGQAVNGLGGAVTGIGRAAIDVLGGGGGDVGSALGAISGGAQIAEANRIRRAALEGAQQDYASRDPGRKVALAYLNAGPGPREDLSDLYANSPNPFARSPRIARAA